MAARFGVERRDLGPFDIVHRQHTPGRVAVHRGGGEDLRELGGVLAQQFQVLGLLPVVEFGGDRRLELLDDPADVVQVTCSGMAVEKRGDLFENFQIGADLLDDAGTLDLDGYDPVATERAPQRRH